EERSEEMLEAVNSMEESLESVEKPEEERAVEYYESSFDMVSKSIDGMYEALDIPENLEDEEQLMEYQERVQQKQEEEMEGVCQVFTGAVLTVRFGLFFKIYPNVVFYRLPLQADAFRGHGLGLLARKEHSLRGPRTRAVPAGVAALCSSQTVFHAYNRCCFGSQGVLF